MEGVITTHTLEELEEQANTLINTALTEGYGPAVEAVQPTLWHAGCALAESPDRAMRRLGFGLALTAACYAPQLLAIQPDLPELRRALLAADAMLGTLLRP